MIIAIFSGFLEVWPERIIVLTDAAERTEEIDEVRVEEAKRRAEQALADSRASQGDKALAKMELRQSLVRLKVIEKKRKRKPGIWPSGNQV